MSNKDNASRRKFLKQSSLGLSAGLTGVSLPAFRKESRAGNKKLPREVTVVSIDLVGWPDKTTEYRLKRMFQRIEEIAGLEPDVICLPELFDTMWVDDQKNISQIAEDEKTPGPVTSRAAEYARKYSCYVVCPVVTEKDGHYYNSSLLIDRKGGIAGVYHKIHPTVSEMTAGEQFIGGGVTPGALNQPVVVTEFGKVGMQICYDANWTDGWDNLRKQGAELILFSSAFPGGRMLNYHALRNNCYIASSTGQDARIIDMSGNNLDVSSEFVRYAWSTINLEKENVTIWPARNRLPELFSKYRERLGVKVWGSTGIITIESRDPELKVANALKEFGITPYAEFFEKETAVQTKYRPG